MRLRFGIPEPLILTQAQQDRDEYQESLRCYDRPTIRRGKSIIDLYLLLMDLGIYVDLSENMERVVCQGSKKMVDKARRFFGAHRAGRFLKYRVTPEARPSASPADHLTSMAARATA